MKVYLVWWRFNRNIEETLDRIYLYYMSAVDYINSLDEYSRKYYRIEERTMFTDEPHIFEEKY